METPSGKGRETPASLTHGFETHIAVGTTFETPAVEKGKKLGIKRVKKTPNLNISKGKLKSVATPKSFSYLNMSVQKQTLRANNRALAQNLAKARQDIRGLNLQLQTLRSQQQEQDMELNRLRRLVGMKDEQIQLEVRLRIQDEMHSMQGLIEELTQSMMQSSRYITKMNDRCIRYSPRNSTDSARSLSLDNSQDNQTLNHPSTRDQGKRSDLMAKYLSKADEFMVPQDGGIFNDGSGISDMSIIAEQSMLDNDEDVYTAQVLSSVKEIAFQESATLLKPISKLPQRVLQCSVATKSDKCVNLSESTTNPNTNSSELESVTSEMDINSSTISGEKVNEKEEVIKTKEKERSKSSRTCESKSGKDTNNEAKSDKDKDKNNEPTKKNDSKHSRTKEKNVDKGKNVKDKMKLVGYNTDMPEHKDLDADISAFGFGGSFIADLVSGSPISEEKRRDTFVKVKQPGPIESKLLEKSEDESHRETVTVPKARNATVKVKKDSKNGGGVKKDLRNMEKSNSSNRQNINGSSIQDSNQSLLKQSSKQSRKETYATENPFVSKKPNVQRSPVKILNRSVTLHTDVKDPFKPTRTLLRSPVHVTVQRAVSESRDSLAFLATLRESLDSRSKESSPLPQPMFQDEPTTYFNSDMEFTSVIDSSKLIQSLSRSEGNGPIVSMETVPDSVNGTNSDKQSNSREDLKLQNAAEKESVEKSDTEVQQGSCDVAAVEFRTNKPGVFTFSVARKEADGTRKPVPEKVSMARSKKKKKPVSPEKDERKTGSDRDMFNFGDRTPTMPLDKITKAKSVYDLSMNESVAVPTVSLKNFKERADRKLPQPKSDDHIYYLPLKGSPDEKPVSTHSRSRSKSRKPADDDDEDWVPESKARARSKSQSKKTQKEEISRSRSQSRRRVVQDLEADEEAYEDKTRARSKSVSRKREREASTYRRGRSQSRSRVVKDNEKAEDVDEDIQKEKTQALSESRSRESEKEEIVYRRGRSQSRRRVVKDNESDEDVEENVSAHAAVAKSHTRSKSSSRKACNEELAGSRHSRSKSTTRAYLRVESEDEVESSEMKSNEKVLTELISRRSRSRTRVRNKPEIEVDTVISEISSVKCYSENGPSAPRRSARSKLQIWRNVDDNADDVDGQEASPGIQRKSTSRLTRRRNTYGINVEDEDNKEMINSKITKLTSSTESDMKISEKTEVPNTQSCTIMLHLDEESAYNVLTVASESNEDSINPRYRKQTEKHKAFVIEDSDSDSENIRKCETLRRKSRRRIKSAKYDDSTFVTEINNETERIGDKELEDCVDDALENNQHRNLIDCGFISRRRGKSARLPSLDDDGNNVNDINSNENTEKQTDNTELEKSSVVCDNEYDDEKLPDALKVQGKIEVRKPSKSTKKSTKKRRNEVHWESKSRKSRVNMIERLDTEDISKQSTLTVTPAVQKEMSKKSSKSSRTARGTKAMKVECLPDQTPVTKEDRNYPASAKMSTLALLKKRLTMAGKHRVQEETLSNDLESRKRLQTDFDVPDGQQDANGSPDNKRTRRNKIPVSYVSKPLNVKLRRGDPMFQDTMSKVKAEQSRLVIAKKISVPQISRGDKENIMHKNISGV